ncbi:fatty acyl-AMP ligase [Streptomyces sp. PSKA30]|uniref:fatty acyl-AMP ligase n=1 Tax=Streptomyces sp. PSKA30 TaxID=2874597 RepID=UPI001CD0A06F|nr:fatty acyl-AMP ligase [Streptomyces sp. PSKA30]MBZ9639646.1 fatty acyl-AMP ligase [Streptomyces sp. PSKA30]
MKVGDSVPSPIPDTLSDCLADAAAAQPDETAFTFVDYSADMGGVACTLTWRQLEGRVRLVAAGLRHAGAVGERVAVVAPQSLDYIVAFLAAACAGCVAVPLFPPSLHGHQDKLAAVLQDAAPMFAVTTEGQRASVTEFCATRGGLSSGLRVVTERQLREMTAHADEAGRPWHRPRPEDAAYLQYTSGSTRTPSGVEITHANVCANARQALEAYDIRTGRNCTVGWLPLYHDMGLVLAVAMPIVGHVPSVLMDPLAFIQQPVRWLRLLTRHPGALTAAPNFAYDYCIRRVQGEERAELSLGSVTAMVNGSEPVGARTLERFQAAFAPVGMARTVMRPSYGLAEATVFVSASPAGEEPTVTSFDRDALGLGVARVAEPADGVAVAELVACGRPVGQEIAIVDPVTSRLQEDGRVGEIWLRGPNIGRGYWGRPEQSEATFRATLHGDDPSDPAHHWLRTGDLGMWHGKQLYVTGRLKDLVIIDGTNHYPHDIEETVQDAHPAIRPHHVAAFAVDTGDGERLITVAEHRPDVTDPDGLIDEVARSVRAAVATGHGVRVHDFVLAPPGTVPHTTSGKVARTACRERYMEGAWTAGTYDRERTGSA